MPLDQIDPDRPEYGERVEVTRNTPITFLYYLADDKATCDHLSHLSGS
jgi:hypothetical protein